MGHKRWSIHEKTVPSNAMSTSNQPHPNKKLSNPTFESSQNISTNGAHSSSSSNHPHLRNNHPNAEPSTDLTDGSMASFLRRALRIEGPQLSQRTTTIKKTVR